MYIYIYIAILANMQMFMDERTNKGATLYGWLQFVVALCCGYY